MWLLAWALLTSCAPEAATVDRREPGVRARMDFTRAGGLYDAPFPSDDLRGDDGVDLEAYPDPAANPYVASVLSALGDARAFGTTMGVFVAFDGPLEVAPVAAVDSMASDAPVWLAPVDDLAARVPIDVVVQADAGPYGAPNLLSALPVQGVPLRPDTTYVLVVHTRLHPDLVPADAVRQLIGGEAPPGLTGAALSAHREALAALLRADVPQDGIAAVAVYTTDDPVAAFRRVVHAAQADPPATPTVALTEVFDHFCVFEGEVAMPVFQAGDAPYETDGGGWVLDDDGLLVLQRTATSRFWLTIPREPTPPEGFPAVVMVRTGGGGDNPLVHRGVRAEAGGEPVDAGTGPAMHFAAAGWAGISVDGPHGGPRNVTGADEQFLMFSVSNPLATRDNVRQSALELALLPDVLVGLQVDARDCPGADPDPTLDLGQLALMGHSMGATIAPLVLAAEPRYRATILSGAGGSYIHNLVYKESPLPVRPLAESILGYVGRDLHPHDPFLSVLQWAAEPADPPPYLAALVHEERAPHTLMLQGIVDTYILPPMANATSLAFGLDLVGPPLDSDHPELVGFAPLADLLPLVGGAGLDAPVAGNRDGRTAVVVQHAEDGIEDGHEVAFQTERAPAQYRCFLASLAGGGVPELAWDGCE